MSEKKSAITFAQGCTYICVCVFVRVCGKWFTSQNIVHVEIYAIISIPECTFEGQTYETFSHHYCKHAFMHFIMLIPKVIAFITVTL